MPDTTDTGALAGFLAQHRRLAVLTGAGCSTASGIPEYRDDDGEWKHAPPVQFAEFVASAATRQRYWARSAIGWRRIAAATPNAAHRALAGLDAAGRIEGLITQNVDNLHRLAGSRNVIDLHGTLERVRCLACGDASPRADYQARLESANPDWDAPAAAVRPDGDVDLAADASRGFQVPPCERCGGILKPDVVFFGESVPRERVQAANERLARADALLVVGSSLMVFSGFRFVRQAAAAGQAIAIVNRGRTRADGLATLRVNGDCAPVLEAALAACRGADSAA